MTRAFRAALNWPTTAADLVGHAASPDRARPSGIVLCGLIMLSGCAQPEPPDEQRLVREYFAANNAAAHRGPEAQQDFFRRTQHPDYTDQTCELDDRTVRVDPAMSTFRPDPDFAPDGIEPPRGDVWVVGVEVTTRGDNAVLGHQIGSQHVVLLDGRAYGFAPCPT